MNAPLTDPILQRVSDADPAPATLTDAEAERAEALLARLEATPRGAVAADVRVPAYRRLTGKVKTRLAAASVAVVAVIGAAVLAPTSASADVVLLQAADAAALQPQATGEYWYTHWQIQAALPGGGTDRLYQVSYRQEDWKGRVGMVRRTEEAAAVQAAVDGSGVINPSLVRVEEYGRYPDEFESGTVEPTTFGSNPSYTWDELAALPADADELRERFLAEVPESGHGRDYDLWNQALSILWGSPARPELRRALWQVLAGVPQARLLGHQTDALGREGTAVETRFDDWYPMVLILDPSTGALLQVSYQGQSEGGTDLVYTLVDEGPQDTAPEPQPPLCGPRSVPQVSC